MAKIIQHKSQIMALKPISKCIKRLRSNIYKYIILLLKLYFLDYRVQNVPKNSSKTSPLGNVSKQAKRSDDGNFVNFEFLEEQFCKEKPSFVH